VGRGLVVLHIDGLGADSLEQALREGAMPFTRNLMETEGYEVHRYRCGVPSTTPFVQAGILYGDNSEIPSFRWWDRERRVLVHFGPGSSFEKVADKYFHGCSPLTQDGACIAACYPGGAAEDFGIAYQDRSYSQKGAARSRSAWSILLPYIANPLHILDWIRHTLASIVRTVQEYVHSRQTGRRPARPYVISNALNEIFVHHLTQYAVEKAMREGYSPIYAGFYAFDEAGHAFGPDDRYSLQVLGKVDATINKVAGARDGRYELVVLSDHGQIDTVPYNADGPSFGKVVADRLPGYRVHEMKGKAYGPDKNEARGLIYITSSGGLAHIYLAGQLRRLGYRELETLVPELAADISSLDKVALVMARDGAADLFLKDGQDLRGETLLAFLADYDEAGILREQLSRLNTFQNSGDLVVFGAFKDGKQVNFENQSGGHGSIGGEQLHPFVLAKREWGLDTSGVRGAFQLHPILCRLRDMLAATS
jgi:type I phosphodiesterase/nucleotide pyrophosphatase